jgi:hypothetical protein
MSDTIPLDHLYAMRRDAELDAVAAKARIETLSILIDMAEHPKRPRGRPRKDQPAIIDMPTRVTGAIAGAEPEPPEAA